LSIQPAWKSIHGNPAILFLSFSRNGASGGVETNHYDDGLDCRGIESWSASNSLEGALEKMGKSDNARPLFFEMERRKIS
jgi:hypothetical protein